MAAAAWATATAAEVEVEALEVLAVGSVAVEAATTCGLVTGHALGAAQMFSPRGMNASDAVPRSLWGPEGAAEEEDMAALQDAHPAEVRIHVLCSLCAGSWGS